MGTWVIKRMGCSEAGGDVDHFWQFLGPCGSNVSRKDGSRYFSELVVMLKLSVP